MNETEIRAAITRGEWVSIAPEIRPSIVKGPGGETKPLYCTRKFTYPGEDRFVLTFTNYADAYGQVSLVEMLIEGHIYFGASHPIAQGAYNLDYVADTAFHITPLHNGFVNALNAAPLPHTLQQWAIGIPQNVLLQPAPALGLIAGEYFTEYDLIYLFDNFLFNGSRHIDGRPFDRPENRPVHLQIPLVRKTAA